MIRLIYGHPGTGKTEMIYRALEEDARAGIRAFLIVPEQETVAAEREALLRLPPSAQLHIEVLNFSRLANRVFRERGGLCTNYATPGIRRLVMWRTLREIFPNLHEYNKRAADDRTLPDAMLGTVKELKACGISAAMLEESAAALGDSTLAKKLDDLSLVYSVYEEHLAERFSDASDDLPRLCDKLDQAPFFGGMNVYLDGFTSFTGQEYQVIRRIFAQAENTSVTFGIPGPTYDGIDTVSLRACSDRLRADASAFGSGCEILRLTANHRSNNAETALLSSHLWAPTFPAIPENERGAVTLYRAADVYEEAEDCAARVRILMENGLRCRDILIAARNADTYRGILDPALEKMGIPFFFSEKTDLSSSPLSRLVLSALNILIFGWREGDVINHLKSGLCPIDTRSADLFECYVTKWKITGKRFLSEEDWKMNPRGYVDDPNERDLEILGIVNSVRVSLTATLTEYAEALAAEEDTAGMCRATAEYLDKLGIRAAQRALAVRELNAGHLREAGENARVYDSFLDALDGICDAFSSAPKPDLRTFASALRMILESTQIGSIPTSSDAVTVASANMLRADRPRAVILLGLCDGEFPAPAGDGGLLTEEERRLLTEMRLPLSGNRGERSSDELYYFRRAASAASETVIAYTHTDRSPSSGFHRLTYVFPYLDKKVQSVSAHFPDRLRTPETAADYRTLLRGTPTGTAVEAALRSAGIAAADAPDVPITARRERVSVRTAGEAFGRRITLSNSKIEKFLTCSFAYYCKYVLHLEPWEKIRFSGADIGTFVHFILEKYISFVFLKNGGVFPENEERKTLIDRLVNDYLTGSRAEAGSDDARRGDVLRRLRAAAPIVLDDMTDEIRDGDFTPRYFELEINRRTGITPLTYTIPDGPSAGTRFSVEGKIDRVDLWHRGDRVYLHAMDYKTASSLPELNKYREGRNLQLYLYMMSLLGDPQRLIERENGGVPAFAAVTYRAAATSLEKQTNFRDETELKALIDKNKKSNDLFLDDPEVKNALSHSARMFKKNSVMIAEENFDALRGEVEDAVIRIAGDLCSGKAAAVPSDPRACQYCEYASVCRSRKRNSR